MGRRWAAQAGAGMSLWVSTSSGRPQDCAAFPHLAAPFMREVAAGHLSVVVVQATGKRRAGVAGMKLGLVNVVCTKPSFLHRQYRICGRGMSHNSVELLG